MEFDEQQAVEYMQQHTENGHKYSDDQILNLIDIIWDFYEDNGMLEIGLDDDDTELDVDALIKYAKKMISRDRGATIAQEDIESLVKAELEYESTLDI